MPIFVRAFLFLHLAKCLDTTGRFNHHEFVHDIRNVRKRKLKCDLHSTRPSHITTMFVDLLKEIIDV